MQIALALTPILLSPLFFVFPFVTPVLASDPPITAVTFSPDGLSVVGTSQAGVHVYAWPSLELERTIEVSASNVHCLAFAPDGRQLAVGGGYPAEEGSVEVLSWPTGNAVAEFDDHHDSVRSVAWLDNKRLITASIDREMKLWDLQEDSSKLTLQGHSRSVHAIGLLDDGRTLVSTGADQSVRVWDLESGQLLRSLNQHTQPVHALAICPVERGLPMIASAAGDRTIRFWQPTIGRMLRYVKLDSEALSITWTNEGASLLAACIDGRVRVVDPEQVVVKRTMPAIHGWAYTIAAHPSGDSFVVAGSGGQILRLELSP